MPTDAEHSSPRANLPELGLQLVTFVLLQVRRGRAIDVAAQAFRRHRRPVLGGIIGSAGAAGGAWAALTAWSGSLGVWGTVGLSLGLLSPPAWIPLAGGLVGGLAGGLAGLGAAGGALSVNRARARRRHLSAIVGLSREMAGADGAEGEQLLRGFLRFRGVSAEGARKLLCTSPEQARRAAAGLGADDRLEVARCIFPLVYQGEGVITDTGRRRFRRICADLGLPQGSHRAISREYRDHLSAEWLHLQRLVQGLNYFADALVFDLRELEMVRDLLGRLTRFDPRRSAASQRTELLARLGRDGGAGTWAVDGPIEEASLVAAYALAQTALSNDDERRRLAGAFDRLVTSWRQLSRDDIRRLRRSRERVDRIYQDHLSGIRES